MTNCAYSSTTLLSKRKMNVIIGQTNFKIC